MNAQPQAQQAPAPVNQSGIAMGNMGPLTQQTQQPAPAPQGMQGLDPKLVAAMMAQYAKQKEAEMNARQMALQSPQPQGTVVDQLLAQQGQQPQAPAGIQQLMGAQRGNVAQAQGIDAAPTPQSFKEGGIVGYAGNEGSVVVGPEMFAGDAMRGVGAKDRDSADTSEQSPFEALIEKLGIKKALKAVAERHAEMTGSDAPVPAIVAAAQTPNIKAPQVAVPAAERTWTGRAMDPQQLAAMRTSSDPEVLGAVKAYDAWAAQNPEQAAPPAPAPSPAAPPTYNPAPQNQGSPGGITLALPQRPQPQAAPVEAFANKAMGRDPEAARNAEIARWRAEVGPMDTSANDELLRELHTRKNELAKRPEKGIAGLLDYAKNIAAASKPGNAWWQDMSQGAQHGEAIDEKRREQEMAAMREMLLAQQNGANAKRADRQAGYDVGLKAEDRISKRAETAAGIAGPMRNADRAAEASMYHADTAAAASRYSTDKHLAGVMAQVEKATKAGDSAAAKEALAEIKASMVADQAFLANVQKKGYEATEVDKEDARRAARRIQEASAYLHAKQVPGATMPIASAGGSGVPQPMTAPTGAVLK